MVNWNIYMNKKTSFFTFEQKSIEKLETLEIQEAQSTMKTHATHSNQWIPRITFDFVFTFLSELQTDPLGSINKIKAQ